MPPLEGVPPLLVPVATGCVEGTGTPLVGVVLATG